MPGQGNVFLIVRVYVEAGSAALFFNSLRLLRILFFNMSSVL